MSSAATDSVLQRQQQQYAEYVRQHQLQRSRGGGGSSSSSSRASSRSVPAPASPLGAGGRSGLAAGVGGQSFDESLLQGGGGGGGGAGGDDYALHQEGEQLQYEDPIFHLADGRQLRGHAAVKARAGIWVQDVVAWPSRSFRSRAIMIVHLALCLAITCWLLQVGVRHLHDDFTDPTVSKTDPNPPTNLCRQLPIFLIGTGAIFLLAIGIIGLLMGLAIWRAHAKLESVSFPSLLLLVGLSALYLIWWLIGQVWTFSAHRSICSDQLYQTSLWVIIVSYVVPVLQMCLSCWRICCTKDILPI